MQRPKADRCPSLHSICCLCVRSASYWSFMDCRRLLLVEEDPTVCYSPDGLVQFLSLLNILGHNVLDFLLVVFSVFRISEIGLTVSGAGFGTQKDAFNNHIRNDKITEIFRSLVKQSG